MATSQPPTSQKSDTRPISFVLVDNSNPGGSIQAKRTVTLAIRPEDLVRTDPSRINAQQTLGKTIWADNFGPGMSQININGHTGWRRQQSIGGQPLTNADDGEARFQKLNSIAFVDWHKLRQSAVLGGRNPDDTVELQFVDALDSFACVVAPMSFVLRRSRSRPLLMSYQINMIVVRDIALPKSTSSIAKSPADLFSAGQSSLQTSINTITSSIGKVTQAINNAHSFVDNSIAMPIAQFMMQTGKVLASVQSLASSTTGLTNSMISVARLSAQCGVNIFRSLAAVAGLPTLVKSQFMQVAGAYTNAFCVLLNVLSGQKIYEDYSPLYGASNCSSTSGGRPPSALADVNPFIFIKPPVSSDPVAVTQASLVQMQSLSRVDVVLTPQSSTQVGTAAGVIANGITVSA